MKKLTWYSPYQFSIFRIAMGLYLAVHFAMLTPYAGELFSATGMLPDPALSPTARVFPNILSVLGSEGPVTALISSLATLSLLLAAGVRRRIVSGLLWYGWAALFNRNPLISNPGIPFVGWLLLAMVLIPEGEPLSLLASKKDRETPWEMPPTLYWGAWALMALGYSISGIHKLTAPSWRDGTAIRHVLEIPLARDHGLRVLLLSMPTVFFSVLTWGAVALEALYLPLSIPRKTRGLAWLAIVSMHLGILTLVSFADLTIGMMMIHLFTFDARWLPARRTQGVVFFDGVCGLCNSSVDFILSEDRQGVYRYAPLQGETAARELGVKPGQEFDSLVLKEGDRIYYRSEAVLRIAAGLGGHWAVARVFLIIPSGLRNSVYNWIARNRYRWFGKLEFCRMPTKAERARFLV